MLPVPAEDETLLLLVRHGATPANEQRPYILQGNSINQSLSATGQSQAKAVGEFLQPAGIQHVYASPLLRAVETATAIANHRRLPVQTVDEIQEVHVGQWEGQAWETIMTTHPEEYRVFMENPGETPYLGGESYRDVLNRVQPAFEKILADHVGETIVVVAHNVVNRAYLSHLMNVDIRSAKGIHQRNTGINIIRHRVVAEQPSETEVLTLNAHFHLHL